MILGSKTAQLAVVVPEILSELKKGKSGQLAVFSKIDSRGLEDDVLAGVDTSIRELYRLFKKTLDDKAFFEPANACADVFYEKLIAEPKLARLHHTMRRNYAAALQDDAQQAVNNLMKAEKTEVRLYRLERVKKYAPYPRYLARAAELLGPGHYLYATLQGRRCYFEGILLKMESPLNPDTVLGRRILNKYHEALTWQPEAALTYLAMSTVFVKVLPNPDSMFWYNQKAIEAASGLIQAYTLMASRLTWSKKPEQARQFLEQALALDSTSASAWVEYGIWHDVYGDKAAAETCFWKATSLDSTYEEPYYWLGVQAFDRNDMPDAKRHFLKAAQADKPDPGTFDYLGSIHFNIGEFAEAEKYYLQGLNIEPYHNLLLIHYASTCWKTNRPEQAKALLEKAMAYDSTSAQTHHNVGQAFFYNGFNQEAETAILKSLVLDSTSAYTWVLLGQLYRSMQRTEAALAAVEQGVRLDSTAAWGMGWGTLGSLYMEVGRIADAEHAFKKVISLDSSKVDSWIALGCFYNGTDRLAEAEQIFKKLLRQDSSQVASWITLGGLYRVSGRMLEAEQAFKSCLQQDSSALACQLYLGSLYEATGRETEARQLYDNMLQRDSSLTMHQVLGAHFLTNHRYEEAEAIYQKILRRDPANTSAYYGLACSRGLQNRADEAFAFLEKALKNGWTNYNWMQQDTDLASMREQTERWKALMKKYFPDKVKD